MLIFDEWTRRDGFSVSVCESNRWSPVFPQACYANADIFCVTAERCGT